MATSGSQSSGKDRPLSYRAYLDAVRFIAFLSVFCHHAMQRGSGYSALHVALADSFGFGLCLFFVLSGFLITRQLLLERTKTGDVHLRRFYLKRILRIWPLYFLGLSLGVIHAYLTGILHTRWPWFVAALLFCGNLVRFDGLLVAHLWSISIEEQFYIFWPSVVRCSRRRGIAVAAILILAVSYARLYYLGSIHAEVDLRVWSDSLVQFQMFAAGFLLALAEPVTPKFSEFVSWVIVSLAFLLWIGAAWSFHLKRFDWHASGPAALCCGYATVAVACCLIMVGAAGMKHWPRPVLYLGEISYGLYVFHIPLLYLIRTRLHAGTRLDVLLTFLLTIAVASLSFHFYEGPFLKLKHRIQYIRTQPAA